jgi:hypothetical protein
MFEPDFTINTDRDRFLLMPKSLRAEEWCAHHLRHIPVRMACIQSLRRRNLRTSLMRSSPLGCSSKTVKNQLVAAGCLAFFCGAEAGIGFVRA